MAVEGLSTSLPFILSGEFFKVKIRGEDKSITAQCQVDKACKSIKGRLDATSNFITHLKRKHKQEYETFEKKKKESSGNATKRILPADAQLITGFGTQDPRKRLSKFDRLMIQFVVKGMHPLSIVDQPGFRDLVHGLNSDAPIMSRQTLSRRINDRFDEMKTSVAEQLGKQDFVCTTTDAWTVAGKSRSYLGVTANWISHDLRRQSAALACRRFKGSHTYDRIAELLGKIMREYSIPLKKICKVVTDNGSNFVKAFIDGDFSSSEDIALVEFEDMQSCMVTTEDSDPEFLIPPHQKCTCHTLSLICKADVNTNKTALIRNAITKCNGIWNKSSRSTHANEKIKAICGRAIPSPCATRWNSLFDCLRVLLSFKEKLNEISTVLGVPTLNDRDIDLLEEYVSCVTPIAHGLDRLQGENNTFYGELIPTLLKIVKMLKSKDASSLKYCSWLPEILLKGMESRFKDYITLSANHSDAVLAAVSHPYFKLRWIPEESLSDVKQKFMDTLLLDLSDASANETLLPTASQEPIKESGDSFFDFEDSTTAQVQDSLELQVRNECFQYFNDKDTDINSLHKYPLIKKAFIKYNTPLPSSAPVERLFNYSGMILCPNRRSLDDDLFEMLTLLKVNAY